MSTYGANQAAASRPTAADSFAAFARALQPEGDAAGDRGNDRGRRSAPATVRGGWPTRDRPRLIAVDAVDVWGRNPSPPAISAADPAAGVGRDEPDWAIQVVTSASAVRPGPPASRELLHSTEVTTRESRVFKGRAASRSTVPVGPRQARPTEQPIVPRVSDARVAVGRALVIATVLAWVAYLVTWLTDQFISGGHHSARGRVEAVIYLITVTFLDRLGTGLPHLPAGLLLPGPRSPPAAPGRPGELLRPAPADRDRHHPVVQGRRPHQPDHHALGGAAGLPVPARRAPDRRPGQPDARKKDRACSTRPEPSRAGSGRAAGRASAALHRGDGASSRSRGHRTTRWNSST